VASNAFRQSVLCAFVSYAAAWVLVPRLGMHEVLVCVAAEVCGYVSPVGWSMRSSCIFLVCEGLWVYVVIDVVHVKWESVCRSDAFVGDAAFWTCVSVSVYGRCIHQKVCSWCDAVHHRKWCWPCQRLHASWLCLIYRVLVPALLTLC
jgi:hypothetical protein